MAKAIYNSTSKEYDEEVNLFDINSFRKSYQEVIINNAIIVKAFKDIKRKYKKMHAKKLNN